MPVQISRLTRLLAATGFVFALLVTLPVGAQAVHANSTTGALVVAPDRGFLGNEEVRDAFDTFAADRNAQLLFITDERSEAILDERLASLRQRGATRIAVLPLVLSSASPRWQLVQTWLQTRRDQGTAMAFAPPYGSSYLAVEDLSARLRHVHTDKKRLLLLGYGADSEQTATTMGDALKRMGGFASTLKADAIDAVVYPARNASDAKTLRKQMIDAIAGAHGAMVVPVAFAPRDDTMMDFSGWFAGDLPADAQLVSSPIADSPALAQWMQRAANEVGLQFAPVDASQIGVVALAHGANWFWNRDIEQALKSIGERHKLAYAFSMADPPVVERAVRKLEHQDVRAIVVVRAFGMAASFLPTVERMLGADVESGHGSHTGHAMGGHDMGMMHHGNAEHASLAAPPRIRSVLPMVTVGGVEDDALFAKALLSNARSVSRQPSTETVILVAHGQGEDAANQQWIDLLDSLAAQIRADGGDQFRAIRYATWREDWPDKNKVAVEQVRAMIEDAQRDGGRALIVPARINGRGAADRFLPGLEFGWSQGFAQTPYFAQWFEQEITRGVGKLEHRATTPATATAGTHQH